jgi:hypothetical protein
LSGTTIHATGTIPEELTPAIADTSNPPLSTEEQAQFHNASFDDDNGICATAARMTHALQQSLISAFILFGWPAQDRRNSCKAANKWANTASYIVLFLEYYINSRTMMVMWPFYKQEALILDIHFALKSPRTVLPKTAASIMGKV